MNPNHVIHPAAAGARNSLEAARAANVALREAYAPPGPPPAPAHVAGLHQAINYGLKTAEVEALIAIAEALTPRERILAGSVETTEFRRRLAALEGERAAFTPETLG